MKHFASKLSQLEKFNNFQRSKPIESMLNSLSGTSRSPIHGQFASNLNLTQNLMQENRATFTKSMPPNDSVSNNNKSSKGFKAQDKDLFDTIAADLECIQNK